MSTNETLEQKLLNGLENHGLFMEQAEEVLKRLKPKHKEMDGRWNDLASDYPAGMMTVLWVSAQNEAVAWIDEEKPQHWARAIFTQNDSSAKPDADSLA